MDGEIAPETVEDALDDEDAPLVVDIRPPQSFQQGHIPDSVNLPLADLVGEVDRVTEADHVVTVCPHGKASVKAARLIASYEDFDGRVESMEGGLSAWDGPIARDGATDGTTASDATDGVTAEGDEGPQAPF